jgi:hypothetical protein
MARELGDARQQLHHAAQLASAAGISYLDRRADDSHTNLEWLTTHGALASNPLPAPGGDLRIALRVRDLTLMLLHGIAGPAAQLPLAGETMATATAWLRRRFDEAGLEGRRYTLARHFEIPEHSVARVAAFDADRAALEQLECWFHDAALLLGELRASTPGAGDVRCWPHHFDIATLITLPAGNTIGAGMEPGDDYYPEPYWYVNAHPVPDAAQLGNLSAPGRWHSRDWVGAVLPGSEMPDGDSQRAQVTGFLTQAIAALRAVSA